MAQESTAPPAALAVPRKRWLEGLTYLSCVVLFVLVVVPWFQAEDAGVHRYVRASGAPWCARPAAAADSTLYSVLSLALRSWPCAGRFSQARETSALRCAWPARARGLTCPWTRPDLMCVRACERVHKYPSPRSTARALATAHIPWAT
jgi:hypothetical protein